MPQTGGSFSQLRDNTDRKIYVMLNNNLRKLKPGWRQRIKVEQSDRHMEISLNVVGFGDVPEKGEGEPYATDLLRPGHEKRVTHTEFGLGFEHTETAMEDDRHGQLKKYGMWLVFSANYVLAKRAANLYNNGFTSETTADGVAIFSTSHVLAGGGTFSNRSAADTALSWNGLRDAIITMETETKHDSGQLADTVENLRLVVPPHLEMLAERVVNSVNLPGVADNDVNAIKERRKIQIDVDKLLTDTNAWFLQAADNDMHGLRSFERVALSQAEPMTDARTGNRLYKIRGRYSWFGEFPQGVFGNAGA